MKALKQASNLPTNIKRILTSLVLASICLALINCSSNTEADTPEAEDATQNSVPVGANENNKVTYYQCVLEADNQVVVKNRDAKPLPIMKEALVTQCKPIITAMLPGGEGLVCIEQNITCKECTGPEPAPCP